MHKICNGVLITCNDAESKKFKNYIYKALEYTRINYIKKINRIKQYETSIEDSFFESYVETAIYNEESYFYDENNLNALIERTELSDKYLTLSEKQQEIIKFRILGYTNKKIALLLGVSERTVNQHLKSIRNVFEENNK